MRHLKKDYPSDTVRIMEFPIKFKVQPPTFRTVSEAYAYFTRHKDEYPQPDYDDDSDDLPQFVTDPEDFFVSLPDVAPPSRGERLPSPDDEEGDQEPATQLTDEEEGEG